MSRVFRSKFAGVPVWVYRHPDMTPTVMQVYLALSIRATLDEKRKLPKGVTWIMEDSGLKRAAVYAALVTLREMGALTDRNGGLFLPNDEPPAPTLDSMSMESESTTVEPESTVMDKTVHHRGTESTTVEPTVLIEKALREDLEGTAPKATKSEAEHRLDEEARACAQFAFEQTPKPVTAFPAVQTRCREALSAGHTPDELCEVIASGDVTWTRTALEFRLGKVKGAGRSGSNVDAVFDAAARWRKAHA